MSSNGWARKKLEDIAVFHDSSRVPLNSREREKRKGKYPYYGASGIVDYIDGYIFDGEYVLISEDGENLRSRQTPIAFKADGKFWVNNHAHVIKGKEPFLNDWIVYFFQNFDINPFITGAVQPKLNKENLQLIEIPLPDFDKAKKIVSILSALDDKIELNRQTNATLEAIAQSIFKEWFVDGKDVENWKVGKLEEIVDINMGQSPSGESYNQNGEGIIFFQGKAEFGFRFPTVDKYTTEPKKFAKPFDTLLSVRAPVGSINMASEKCCIGRGLAAISGKNNVWSFTFYLLKSLEEHFNSYEGTGTVFGSINKKELENITVVIPPQETISEFERIVNPIDMAIFNLEQQSATLASLRDTLLPKLMSGEIEITNN